MSTSTSYILIRRLPTGEITSHTTPFGTTDHAARAAALVLQESGVAGSAAARLFGDALGRRPVGTIWGHKSGYDFRILQAHFTTDGVAITPGLKVITNDLRWGVVEATQFMSETDSFGPSGTYFDGWYLLNDENNEHPYAKFNGARLATMKPSSLRST